MIQLKNVEKFYETGAGRTYVLRRVDMDVREGEFVSIMGPSGSGKTTLLSILGFLDSAWGGEFNFMGQPVHKMNHKERAALHKRHVGFVFQSYHLIDGLTVRENLEVPLSYRDVKRAAAEATVADALDQFQIVGKKDLFPSQLSGGQQQLVAVARAVIHGPKLILAEEATGKLHASQGRECVDRFKRLNEEGTGIVQVTRAEVSAGDGNGGV